MKPDWKDAPEWANYVAMDRDGAWCWYQLEPAASSGAWETSGGKYEYAVGSTISYRDTLEARPEGA